MPCNSSPHAPQITTILKAPAVTQMPLLFINLTSKRSYGQPDSAVIFLMSI